MVRPALPCAAVLLVACQTAPRTVSTAGEHPPASGAADSTGEDPPATAPAPMPGAARFWVSADEGLIAYDLDGVAQARFGPAGLEHARRLADGRVVGLVADGEALTLVELDAAGEIVGRTPVANGLDLDRCALGPATGAAVALTLQSPRDFGFGGFGEVGPEAVCLRLLDRNENMASYGVELTYELASGGWAGDIDIDIDGACEGKSTQVGAVAGRCVAPRLGGPWVDGEPDAGPPADAWPFAFDELRAAVVADDRVAEVVCAPGYDGDTPAEAWGLCAAPESRSPSGRWQLLSGRWDEGDYIYRDLVLLDLADGSLWQIDVSDRSLAFAPVTPADIFAEPPVVQALHVVGESELAWLPGDRLWVDGVLVIPERRRAVELGGRLVWSAPAAG